MAQDILLTDALLCARGCAGSFTNIIAFYSQVLSPRERERERERERKRERERERDSYRERETEREHYRERETALQQLLPPPWVPAPLSHLAPAGPS